MHGRCVDRFVGCQREKRPGLQSRHRGLDDMRRGAIMSLPAWRTGQRRRARGPRPERPGRRLYSGKGSDRLRAFPLPAGSLDAINAILRPPAASVLPTQNSEEPDFRPLCHPFGAHRTERLVPGPHGPGQDLSALRACVCPAAIRVPKRIGSGTFWASPLAARRLLGRNARIERTAKRTKGLGSV